MKSPKTHCSKGHELTTENQYFWKNTQGKTVRRCIQCRDDYRAAYYWKKKKEREEKNGSDSNVG
jgi:hypothetical protein